jgi:site-specific DNA-methyltransferase (adenine-specific)
MSFLLDKKKIENNNDNINNNIDCNITEMELLKFSKQELLKRCEEIGALKCKTKSKSELIEIISNYNKKNHQKKIIIEDDEDTDNNKDESNSSNSNSNSSNSNSNSNNSNSNNSNSNNNNIIILNNDCMIELDKLKDNSIDCVITDPPYFIDKLDNSWSSIEVNCDVKNSHIKHLPKGMKFDKSQVKNLYDYYLILSKLLFKKMKPGAYFLSFSSPRLYHAIAMSCEIAGFEIRDMINWTYTQSMPKGMSISHIIEKMDLPNEEKTKLIDEYKDYKTPQIRSCFEPICVAMKPIGKITFIQNELQFKTGLLDFSQKVGKDNDRVPANIITTDEYNESYDKNFLVSKPSKSEKGENNTHITVKPIALMEHLVKLFSKKGSLVVDPFLGSGTTALACKNTDRKFFGTELNSEYYEICLNRCK